MANTTASPRHGSLGTGAVTAVALAVQTGLAAVVGVIIAREFGRDAETDGFFAAYGVFVTLALAATAIRVTVLPRFARARAEGRLSAEVAGVARAVSVIALPLIALFIVARAPLAAVLTGFGPEEARTAAAAALPWMGVAAVGQLAAGLLASACAALDDYVVPAIGYIAGSVAGLALILASVGGHGIIAVAWGICLNGVVACLVPAAGLARRAAREQVPRSALQVGESSIRRRLLELGIGMSVPLALQVVYVICLPIAARAGVGAVTSLGYGYLAGSAVVTVAASSIGLVTSVPLTRAGLDAAAVARHITASSWIALIAIGATGGLFATAGSSIVATVLGGGYGADVGDELALVVVALVPWMITSVGVTLVYPLVFVSDPGPRLLAVAGLSIAVLVPLAFLGQILGGLTGIALALAAATGAALAGMLRLLDAVLPTVRGLLPVAAIVLGLAVAAFGIAGLVLDDVPAAIAGSIIYAVLFALIRPRGLREGWRYLHRLA